MAEEGYGLFRAAMMKTVLRYWRRILRLRKHWLIILMSFRRAPWMASTPESS